MDLSARAQGLITYANLPTYLKARTPFPPPEDYKPPKESFAVRCFENVLQKVVFKDKMYDTVFINSQIEPHENSMLRADIGIHYMTERGEVKILCFVEAKRTKPTQSFSTKGVEEEALDYCKEFFHSDRSNKTEFVYAGTLVGTHLRLWIVHRAEAEEDTVLEPLWGSPLLGSNNDYADLGDREGGPLIEKTLHEMVRVAPEKWIAAGISPPLGGGAYQLPRANRPDPAGLMLPSVVSDLSAPPPPADYERIKKFVSISSSYGWLTVKNAGGSGPSTEWKVEGHYLVNHMRRLYADKGTENVPGGSR
ncbi:hypothetical protein BO71DRAFT_400333 [Aspergillus ellipticus CBS 707.79]|uniref:Uncharacterized protein n=1 Tax=Aspergillus ellipticus CBS 707.79 TaxID=1448320 RepID=A0A319EP31_9EURO|nr:hypothetical protein BO71DRAFT_400333 [Aspergillus ellipticus CBS 707.79]